MTSQYLSRRGFLMSASAAALTGCAAIPEPEVLSRWPAIGEIIEVDGIPIHYWDRGSGPSVVLIHGASGNLRDWTFQIAPRLAETHRVIAFDRPGFGHSGRVAEQGWDPAVQAALLAKATAQLGADDPVIAGHSWGGALAMAWGVDRPDAVSGIVSVAGATMPWGGELSFFYEIGASDVTGPLFGRIVSAVATEKTIASHLVGTFSPQPVPEGYADYVGGPLATRPRVARYNAEDIENLHDALTRQSARYGALEVPVEIIHGQADNAVWPDIHAVAMHYRLPNSRLTLLQGVGHMPHHANPDAVIAAINRLTGQG